MSGCNSCGSDPGVLNHRDGTWFRGVLWVALVVNLTMFCVEVVASIISGSASLQADAVDFLGDAANYGISLFVLGMALRVRAMAALIKGGTMALFGLWVMGYTVYRTIHGLPPDALVMGWVGLSALIANVGVATMLFRYRKGDSNMRSIWLCSRNDVLGNVMVLAAAAGVALAGSHWPDILAAGLIASLNLTAAYHVVRHAADEIRQDHAMSRSTDPTPS